jgi:hypothetical protein
LSEKKTYRKFTPQQKLELVMASWRGERSIAGASSSISSLIGSTDASFFTGSVTSE